MKSLTFLLILFCLVSFDPKDSETWLVEQQSVLTIYGKTNINEFSCKLPGKDETDTLLISSFTEKELIFEKGRVKVDPTIFNCGNEFIKRDFLETVKAKEFPYIYINFLDIHFEQSPYSKVSKAHGNVGIYICGIKKTYNINFDVNSLPNNKIQLNGQKELKLSEFNIKTPSRMMGLIKVSDDIEIEFQLMLSKYSI